MTTTRTYSVPGISCAHCQAAIEGEVGKLDEVEMVAVDLDGKTVTVTGSATDVAVRDAIDEAGYDVAGVR